MPAVRAPLVGVVVAMLLLIAENLGANAYRDHMQSQVQPQLSEQMRSAAWDRFERVSHCRDGRRHKGD